MNLCNLEAFLAVVYNRSVTQAANSLFVSQSTVSNRLKVLEEELEVKLFERRPGMRGIELTPKGEELVPLAEKWVTLWHDTKNLKYTARQTELTIGCPDSVNIQLLMPFYQKLAAEDPAFYPHIRTQQSNEIYSLLDSHEIDVGIVTRQLQYKNIIARPVFREQLLLVCRRGSGLPCGPVHPSMLCRKNEIYLGWSLELQQWHEIWWPPDDKPYAHVDTPSLILGLMAEPRFWALCPLSVVRSFQIIGDFEVHPFSVTAPERICYLIQHRFPLPQKAQILEGFTQSFDAFCRTLEWRWKPR